MDTEEEKYTALNIELVEFERRQDVKLDTYQKHIYQSAFLHAWKYQQNKLNAYASYIANEITLAELEKALK